MTAGVASRITKINPYQPQHLPHFLSQTLQPQPSFRTDPYNLPRCRTCFTPEVKLYPHLRGTTKIQLIHLINNIQSRHINTTRGKHINQSIKGQFLANSNLRIYNPKLLCNLPNRLAVNFLLKSRVYLYTPAKQLFNSNLWRFLIYSNAICQKFILNLHKLIFFFSTFSNNQKKVGSPYNRQNLPTTPCSSGSPFDKSGNVQNLNLCSIEIHHPRNHRNRSKSIFCSRGFRISQSIKKSRFPNRRQTN